MNGRADAFTTRRRERGHPARHERVSAKAEKLKTSALGDNASLLSVLAARFGGQRCPRSRRAAAICNNPQEICVSAAPTRVPADEICVNARAFRVNAHDSGVNA
jgi:hypothetical protein